jgi:hypothetical protein
MGNASTAAQAFVSGTLNKKPASPRRSRLFAGYVHPAFAGKTTGTYLTRGPYHGSAREAQVLVD